MDTIKVKDKEFRLLISEDQIKVAVKNVADQINKDLKGKNPLFLAVLNGSFMFASDLMKNITIPSEISFIKLASYNGTKSDGKVKELVGLAEHIEGRSVVIVEDIVDSGHTMLKLLSTLSFRNPAEIRIATFLSKPDALQCELNIDYVAFSIPNDFVVGYGLDYDGYGRNYGELYSLIG